MLKKILSKVFGKPVLAEKKKDILRETPEAVWKSLIEKSSNPKKILFASHMGGNGVVNTVDRFLGTALTLRGHDVSFLLCDKALPACEMAQHFDAPELHKEVKFTPSAIHCESCFKSGLDAYKNLHMPTHLTSENLAPEDLLWADKLSQNITLEDAFSFEEDGIKIGDQVRAGVIRFFGNSELHEEDQDLLNRVVKQYFKAGLLTYKSATRLLQKLKPDIVINHHGIYVPQGIFDEVAIRQGCRIVVWGTSYRDRTLIFSHGHSYHFTFPHEPVEVWENMPWDKNKEKNIMDYLHQRRHGKGDWSWVTPERGGVSYEAGKKLYKSIGLEPNKETYGLLTNLGWDAQLYYTNDVFASMFDWLYASIEHFSKNPHRQLIVRIHPHEIKPGNREFVMDRVKKKFGGIPPNIVFIDRTSPYSTYELMDLCRVVILYGTKVGVEVTPFGKPVLVAGDAWIKNKDISIDAKSTEDYLSKLDSIDKVLPLSEEKISRARKFSYHFFFRRMIPFNSFMPKVGFPPQLKIKSIKELKPEHDPGLDLVCEAILENKPFVFNA